MLITVDFYKLFYWFTVADGLKGFFDTISNVSFFFMIILGILLLIVFGIYMDSGNKINITEDDEKSYKYWMTHLRRLFILSTIITVITWTLYIAIPSKKDAVIILAGGSVGNFIVSDSSAKNIPAELTLLVREQLKSEIKELTAPTIVDTLTSKSKEELIQLLKQQK